MEVMDIDEEDIDDIVFDSKSVKKKTRERRNHIKYSIEQWLYTFNVVEQPKDGIATTSPILISKKQNVLKLNLYYEDVKKLLHIIELILNFKRTNFDLYSCLQPRHASGLRTTFRRSLMCSIRSCVVSKRYPEAAKLLELLAVEKEAKDHIFFYGTFKILNNTQNIASDQIEMFIRSCLLLIKLNKKEVLLEFIMYKFQKKQMELPRDLSQKISKYRNILRKNHIIDTLHTAYISLYHYISWAKLLISPNFETSQEDSKLKDSFVSALSDIVSQEGTWDIFILKIQEMLEYYDELDECEEILENHLYANQENLHSHVYFYEFLIKYNRSKEKQRLALENIVKISPSDILALEFVNLLVSECNREKAIEVLLNFLEYSQNKENNAAWEELVKLYVIALENSDVLLLKCINKCWTKLRSYWPFYHFNIKSIDVSLPVKAKCIISKCEFLLMVAKKHNDDISYIETAKTLMKSNQPKCYKKLVKKLNKIDNLLKS